MTQETPRVLAALTWLARAAERRLPSKERDDT